MGYSLTKDPFVEIAKKYLPYVTKEKIRDQTYLPNIAKDPVQVSFLRAAIREVETEHVLYLGDSRNQEYIESGSVQLVVTSPPYWSLKKYNETEGQLGEIVDYDEFVEQLNHVWEESFRVLTPGGRLVIVVGDVCLSRRNYGRHVVFPLHASIQEGCRKIGFDNLSPIIWNKIANAQFESGGGGFLGKPFEPNGVIKNDIEYILMQRKPGGYRKPTEGMRLLSVISADEHQTWFQPIWQLPGASLKNHPAPFPLSLAERLIRMFSFVGDTVLDPFAGSGTTLISAKLSGRNSVGIEIDKEYATYAKDQFKKHTNSSIRLVEKNKSRNNGNERRE